MISRLGNGLRIDLPCSVVFRLSRRVLDCVGSGICRYFGLVVVVVVFRVVRGGHVW